MATAAEVCADTHRVVVFALETLEAEEGRTDRGEAVEGAAERGEAEAGCVEAGVLAGGSLRTSTRTEIGRHFPLTSSVKAHIDTGGGGGGEGGGGEGGEGGEGREGREARE